MKLGINQIMLLHRCLKKGCINSYDVKIVYNLSTSRNYTTSNNKAVVILQKLELRNLILKVPDSVQWKWKLTDDGKEALIENLPKSHNQHAGAS